MAKVIIYQDPVTNSAGIIVPAWDDPTRPAGETESQCLTRVIDKTIGPNTPHAIVDDSTLPRTRENREYWYYHHDSRSIRIGGT
jgi:hypothetical protein